MAKKIKILTLLFLIALLLTDSAIWADPAEDFHRKYPFIRNISNAGTDFYFSIPPGLTDGEYDDDLVYVVVTSQLDSKVELNIPYHNYSDKKNVAAGQSEVFTLTPKLAQAYIKTGHDPAVSNYYQKNGAIHLSSDQPVVVRVYVDYRDSEEGFLLYPIHMLGSKYTITSYNDGVSLYPSYNSFPNMSAIISMHDDNMIEFKFNGIGRGAALSKGETSYLEMDKGDVWLASSYGIGADLSGSVIKSEYPIAVITACQSASIPDTNKWHNYLIEQELHSGYWGHLYYTAAFHNRLKTPIFRIYTENEVPEDTTIVYAHTEIGTDTIIINESTAKYGSNFIEYRPDGRYTTFESDKKIFISQYSSGTEEEGTPTPRGSPAQLSICAVQNYGSGAVFSIDENLSDNLRNRSFIQVFIDEYDEDKEIKLGRYTDDEILYEDATKYVNEFKMMPGTNGSGVYFLVELVQYGDYVLDSEMPFTANLYTLTGNASIISQAVINPKLTDASDIYKPLVTVDDMCMNKISGTVCDKPDDDSKRSNLTTPVFDMTNYSRIIDPIVSGETQCSDWKLIVKNEDEPAVADILFRDCVGNDTLVHFAYIPPSIKITPTYYDFGSILMSNQESHIFTLTNLANTDFLLNKAYFENGGSDFEVIGNIEDTLIPPDGIYEFEISFTAKEKGSFIDSVSVGNDCYLKHFAIVEASVGEPIIQAYDLNFGNIEVSRTASKTAIIFNTGLSDLIITDWELIGDDEFTPVFDRNISNNNPLIVKPKDKYTFKIECLPTLIQEYAASITFTSNAVIEDSIIFINANGIESGLIVSNYDYGRKRINRVDYPIQPYAIENEFDGIRLYNIGKNNILIENIEIFNGLNDEAFEFNRNQLRNLTLGSKKEYVLPIHFNPKDTGDYVLEYYYILEGETKPNAKTLLLGSGIVPKIKYQAVDFDTVLQSNNYITKEIVIKNLSANEWKWADSLRIYDFEAEDPSSISFNPLFFGTENYSIDLSAIDMSKPIPPGATVTLSVHFMPYREGLNQAYLNIISDAFNQDLPPLKLTAYVRSNDVVFAGGSANVCEDQTSIIIGHIENNTLETIDFLPIILETQSSIGDFILLNEELLSDFTLEANQTKEVQIEYTANTYSSQSVVLSLLDKNDYYNRTAVFYGYADRVGRNLTISPIKQSVLPGKKYACSINLDAGVDIDEYDVRELFMTIHYSPNMLLIRQSYISLGAALKGDYDFVIEEMNTSDGYIKIRFYTINETNLNESGELLNIDFLALLDNTDSKESEIIIELEDANGTCVKFDESIAILESTNYCASAFRDIIISDEYNSINSIFPNPVKHTAELDISLMFDSNLELNLVSLDGSTIAQPLFKGELIAGDHKVTCDFTQIPNISNGIYFIEMKTVSGIVYKKIMILR